MSFEITFLVVLALFFAFLVFEGVTSLRRTAGEADYFVSGRRVGAWVGGASLAATQMSAGTFVGVVAAHYLTGASYIWIWSGIWVAYLVLALWVGPRLRAYSAERDRFTIPELIEDRFGTAFGRGLVAVLLVIAYLVFISAQYQAGGVIVETVFGISFEYGVLIIMALVALYAAVGGMRAVMRTDFLQQVVMALGVVVGVPFVIGAAGGWDALATGLSQVEGGFTGWGEGVQNILGFFVAFGLQQLAAPSYIIRFYTMRDNATARRSVSVALLFNLLVATSIGIIGMTMRVLYPDLSNPDAASTIFASQVLPNVLGALLLTAIIAAVMSTVDSVLLVGTSAISYDLYHRLLAPNASRRQRMRVNRGVTLALGTIPVLLTLREFAIVIFIVLAFSSLLVSTVFAPVIGGLYWRRATAAGAITSMVVGFGVCLTWYLLGEPLVAPVIPGVVAAILAMVVVSLLTRPSRHARMDWFFPERPALDAE